MTFFSNKILQVVALTAVTSFAVSALAQPRSGGRQGGGFRSMMSNGGMTPDYMLRDLQQFQIALELEEQQMIIVEQILRDYDESFREASEASQTSVGNSFASMRGSEDDPARQNTQELRSRSREIRNKLESTLSLGDEPGMKELQERLNGELEGIRADMQQARVAEWQTPERQAAFEEIALLMQDQQRLKKQMRDEFEGDLVAILTEDQQELWPPFQRQLTRDRLLPRGNLSGESLDIMSLVEQEEFTDEILISLIPVLNEWDESVTPALTARDNHMVENQSVMMTSMSTMDSTAGLDVMKAQAKLSEDVRDINDNAIEQIVFLLPEEHSGEFDATAKTRGYPRIYRPTRTDRAYKAAMELEDLEPDILQSIHELYESMQIEISYANEQILEATHRWESEEQLNRMNRFAQRMSGVTSERPESPIQKAEENKRSIEDNYLDQLRMLLTPEQIEALGGLQTRSEREASPGERRNRTWDRGRDNDRGFEGGREAFMQHFDTDGDGTISESEREAIRDHFRNGGAAPGSSGGSRGGGSGQGGGNGGNSGQGNGRP